MRHGGAGQRELRVQRLLQGQVAAAAQARNVQCNADGETWRSAFSAACAQSAPSASRRLDDVGHRRGGEAMIDRRPNAPASENGGRVSLNAASAAIPSRASAADSSGSRARGGEMGREPGMHGIGAGHPQTGQAEIDAKLARQPRQQEGSADVGEKPIAVSGIAKPACSRGHTVWRMHRQADAAAHADAVDQRDIGLRIGRDRQVQRVFLAKRIVRRRRGRRTSAHRAARGCRRRRRRRGRRRPRSPRHRHADRRARSPGWRRRPGSSAGRARSSARGRLSRMRPTRPSRLVMTVSSVVIRRSPGLGIV